MRSPQIFCRGAPQKGRNKKGPDKYLKITRREKRILSNRSRKRIVFEVFNIRTGVECKTLDLPFSTRSEKFKGICVDTGAQRSVVGRNQAKAYCKSAGITFKTKPSAISFKFGDGIFDSLGKIPVRIPTPDGGFLPLEIDVVKANIPMLIGLEVLDQNQLVADNLDNELVSKRGKWSLPITRKNGHLFVEWDFAEILYTKSELRKLHLHFYHPSVNKLYNLIRRAKPEDATSETKQLLEDIAKACSTCQRFEPRPQSFQVSVPSGIVFNQELALDLMFLDKIPVLHVVDTQTHFSSAVFLHSQSTEAVWHAFLECWATLYTGYPDKMRVDQGSQFTSKRWKELTEMTGIQLCLSGVESHNSIGSGERYHAPLRRIYQKIRYSEADIQPELALRLAVKAMNDTMNPEGLVPSLLVFGVLPRFPALHTQLPNHEERMRALKVAQMEMETITSELRLRQALLSRLPNASKQDLEIGQEVLVFREDEKPIKWTGPFKITRIEDKQVFVDKAGQQVQHSVAQVKPYVKDTQHELVEALFTTMNPMFTKRYESHNVHLSETLHPRDPRAYSQQFITAKKKEIQGLIDRGTWKVVLKEEVPKDANVLSGRFVLTIKNANTEEEVYKARYVVQVHRDKEINSSSMTQQQCAKVRQDFS